jgi:phosphate transport system substrate-binding protein
MKKIFSAAILFSALFNLQTISAQPKLKGNITISGAYALYPLAVKWSEEFKKIYPDVIFDIQAGGAGKGITDALAGTVDFGMVSRAIRPEEIAKGANPFGVAIDAVVPTFNLANPLSSVILSKGIKREGFASLWLKANAVSWGQLLGTGDKNTVKVYSRSDAAGAAESWAKYLGGNVQEDLKGGVAVFGDPGLLGAVLKEKYAIGYNNIGFAYNPKTRKPNEGVGIIPIDLNGNGRIDADENFYGNLTTLMKAIAAHKYPYPPARLLYFISKGDIKNPAAREFIKWVLTEGQKYNSSAGFVSPKKETLDAYRIKIK